MVAAKEVMIIMQARMSSERLPGKVLRTLGDNTLLGHILSRMKKSVYAKDIIVATSIEGNDDAIEAECKLHCVNVSRGSQEDVLNRFYHAATQFRASHIMRICCDNPFIDYKTADRLIELYMQGDYDYADTKNYPLGIGAEIFPFTMLEKAEKLAHADYQREHVTPFIIENAKNKTTLLSDIDYSDYRFTVDTKEDWAFAQAVYSQLYTKGRYFDYREIIKLLETKPEIRNINKFVEQRKTK